jgi:hypothetical protein
MNCTLSLEYEFSRDGDHFGWLNARLQAPDFTGRNVMLVQWQDLTDYAASLGQYPIDVANPVTCDWGFGEEGRYAPITRVVIAPAGQTGGLVADVSLANYFDPREGCRVGFETDYPSLSDFGNQIERMIRREATSAVLRGHKSQSGTSW